MSWQHFHSLDLTSEWQYTPPCEWDVVRLIHDTSIESSKMLFGQAQTSVITELWDVRRTYAKPEVEIFWFELPEFFEERRFALRTISNVTSESIIWRIHIEAWTMPLYRTATIQPTTSNTANATSIPSATTSTSLLAANPNRKGATIWNASNATLFIEFGATASATAYLAQIGAGDYFEIPYNYTGLVSGIWNAANGTAQIREFV